jgi:hypothetical protein
MQVSLSIPGGSAILGEDYLATIRIDDDDFESGQVRFQITNLNV